MENCLRGGTNAPRGRDALTTPGAWELIPSLRRRCVVFATVPDKLDPRPQGLLLHPPLPGLGEASYVRGTCLCLRHGRCASTSGTGVRSPEQQSDATFRLAVEYYKANNVRLALENAQKAVELFDQNKDALMLASAIFMRFCSDPVQPLRGPDCKLSEAEKYARLALKVDERYRDARNSLAAILIEEKKYDEAIQTLQPLVSDPAREPNPPRVRQPRLGRDPVGKARSAASSRSRSRSP